jgi:hypothetical protein
MTVLAFDTFKFVRKLESVGIPREQAAGITEALVEANTEQGNAIATKSDIEQLELRMTIKLGTLMFVAAGVMGGIVIFALRLMIKA